jgi:Gluconate 2-dehydrogenase subunit 3
MERRAVLKIVALTALSQKLNALPGAAMNHMQAAPAPPTATAYTLQFFTEDESRLLDQLMEMIIPVDDHSPGAHEAQTNLFADLMVANSNDAIKKQWQDGIRLIREDAVGSSLAEALRRAAANEENPKTDLDRFFVLLKQMTVNGYYTSVTGIHKEMEYVGNTYLVAFPECTHSEHREG